jgi:hypothetical protein
MRLGAEAMPVVVERLQEIGRYIIGGNKTEDAMATVQAATPVLVAQTQAQILWYPLNSHTLYDGDVAAIFVRCSWHTPPFTSSFALCVCCHSHLAFLPP